MGQTKKGKDYNKGDGKKGKKGKERGQGQQQAPNAYFNGACSHCGILGHKAAVCRKKSVGAVEQQLPSGTSSSGGSASASSYSVAAVESNSLLVLAVGVHAIMAKDELMLDCGSEEHVCRPDFCPSAVLDEPQSAMRDVAGRDIVNYGSQHVDMKMGVTGSVAHCRVRWQVGQVEKNVLSVGKMIDSGAYRLELDSEESQGSRLIHKPSGQSIPLRRRGGTFTVQAWDMKKVMVAPVQAQALEEPAVGEAVLMPPPALVEDLRPGVGAPDVDAGRPEDPPGLRSWSPVGAMRSRLSLLKAPLYGTKDVLWARLLEYEQISRKEKALQNELAHELEQRRQGLSEQERSAVPIPVPETPSQEQIEAHNLMHFLSKSWCKWCMYGKAVQVGHRVTLTEDNE